jgi:hypothetical protein
MDSVNIHIDELVMDGDGWDGDSPMEHVLQMVPGLHAQQISGSVDQAIGTAVRTAVGTAPGPVTT